MLFIFIYIYILICIYIYISIIWIYAGNRSAFKWKIKLKVLIGGKFCNFKMQFGKSGDASWSLQPLWSKQKIYFVQKWFETFHKMWWPHVKTYYLVTHILEIAEARQIVVQKHCMKTNCATELHKFISHVLVRWVLCNGVFNIIIC